jgi:broad specificity phosphatase PhoE
VKTLLLGLCATVKPSGTSPGRHQGQLDSPPTGRGIRQAECLADGLADGHVDIFFSSDLGRALHTAEIIAKRLSPEICTDLRIRERHHGIVQGSTRKEFADMYPDEAQRFFPGDHPDYVLPGRESARQLYDRSVQCAEDVALPLSGQERFNRGARRWNELLLSQGDVHTFGPTAPLLAF